MDPDAEVTPEFRERTLGLIEERDDPRPGPRVPPPPARLAPAAPGRRAAGRREPRLRRLARGAAATSTSPAAVAPVAAAAGSAAPAAAPLPDLASNPRFSNVAYRPADKDGKVGIGFDVTTRHELDGRPSDPEVAKLLAYLVAHNAETAGESSQAIELVSEHYGAKNAPASPEIVAALSATLRKDENPGVRKKAADALASFPMTPEIRTVFLESLRADKNPAVRLVAVDALAAAAKQSPDASTIQSLREKAVDPQENGFVRAKAASALKSISF